MHLKKNGIKIQNLNVSKTVLKEGAEILFESPISIDSPVLIDLPLKIGAFTYQSLYGNIHHAEIGRYCSLSQNVQIGRTQHPTDWLSSSLFQYRSNPFGWGKYLKGSIDTVDFEKRLLKTTIGNDVWMGLNAYIKEGVTIGDGAIIGASSVVTKDVPPYAIVVGSPARILRYRFDDNTIERFLKLKWWDYKYTDFKNVEFNKPEKALCQIEELIYENKIKKYNPYVLTAKDIQKEFQRQQLFSLSNEGSRRVIRIAGIKISI